MRSFQRGEPIGSLASPLANLRLEMGQTPQQFRLQHEFDLGAGIRDARFELADATVMPVSLVDELQQHCTTLLGLRPKLPLTMASSINESLASVMLPAFADPSYPGPKET